MLSVAGSAAGSAPAALPAAALGTRLDLLLGRVANHVGQKSPDQTTDDDPFSATTVTVEGILHQISLVTDSHSFAGTAGTTTTACEKTPVSVSEKLFAGNAATSLDVSSLVAEHADRMRIWGRLDEADALETLARDIGNRPKAAPALALLLSLASTEAPQSELDFEMPDFEPREELHMPSSVWTSVPDYSADPPAFVLPNEDEFDLAPLYADDETQIDAEEEERELARLQKERAGEFLQKWNAGKAWGEHWVKDISDATYDPRDPLSLAPALANHLHIHHHSRPVRRFLPPSLLISQSLFALGPAGSSWLFPEPGEDDDENTVPLQKDAAVLDISESALRGVLTDMGDGIEAVRTLRKWTEKLRDPTFVKQKCPTLQALLSSLSTSLAAFDEKIATQDLSYHTSPSDVPSLLALSSQLSPDLHLLATFIPLLDKLSDSLYLDPPELSSLVLSQLYSTIDSNRLTWPAATTKEWMRVWDEAMVPMMRWMESWICGGRWEGGYWIRRDADPTAESGLRYEIEKDALPSFMDLKMASKLLSVGRTALHLRRLQIPISVSSFHLQLPFPSAAPFRTEVNAAIKQCIGGTGEGIVSTFWGVLHKDGMSEAFEKVWGIGLGMDVAWRSNLLDGVVGKNVLVWRNETHLNRLLSSHLSSSESPVTIRIRVPVASGDIPDFVAGWDGVSGDWMASYPLSSVLSSDIWGLVARVGAFILQISHAKKLATDLDWLKLNRTNPNAYSSSGRVVQKLRVGLRMSLIAVAEGLQSHFMTTIIAPELEKFRKRLASEPTDPDELSTAHLEMLQRIASSCMLGSARVAGIHRMILQVLSIYAEYELFCRHYDEGTFAALAEPVAALQARHTREDRDDVAADLEDDQIHARRKARDVEKRRLVDTIMIRGLTAMREQFELGLARVVNGLEALEITGNGARFQLEGLIFALRTALTEESLGWEGR